MELAEKYYDNQKLLECFKIWQCDDFMKKYEDV
jgi:hypothetical protein